MSLEQILKEIKEVRPFAEGDAEEGPIETLGGRRGRKVQATERLKELKIQYFNDLMLTSQFIVVTGPQSNKMAEALTSGKQGLFSADPDKFYKDLATRINPALLQGRTSPSDLFDVLGRHLEDKAREIGVIGYPQLIFKNHYASQVRNNDQLVGLIKVAVNEQMGSEIVGIQAVNSIIDTAMEKEHTGRSTSIVLEVKDVDFALDLVKNLYRITNKVYLVQAGKEPKLENAPVSVAVDEVTKDTLKQVISALKGKNQGV